MSMEANEDVVLKASPKAPLSDCLDKSDEEPCLSIDGELDLADYVQDVEPKRSTRRDVRRWLDQQRETTRTQLAMWLVKGFSCSLGFSLLLIGAVAFSPNAEKSIIKELVPQIITSQVTLLGVAAGFYFGSKED